MEDFTDKILLNFSQMDWMTATTKKYNVFAEAMTNFSKNNPDVGQREEKRRIGVMWEGMAFDNGVFFGVKSGVEDRLYIVVMSGSVANSQFAHGIMFSHEWNKTRIDVQITVDGGMSPDKMRKELKSRHIARGKKPQITSITSGENGDGTVYIGSRVSQNFTRLYMKVVDDGRVVTRWETELKGEALNAYLNLCVEHGAETAKDTVIRANIEKFDIRGLTSNMKLLQRIVAMLDEPKVKMSVSKKVSNEESTLRWLTSQVYPAVVKLGMSRSHTTKRRLRAILKDMLEQCERWD